MAFKCFRSVKYSLQGRSFYIQRVTNSINSTLTKRGWTIPCTLHIQWHYKCYVQKEALIQERKTITKLNVFLWDLNVPKFMEDDEVGSFFPIRGIYIGQTRSPWHKINFGFSKKVYSSASDMRTCVVLLKIGALMVI